MARLLADETNISILLMLRTQPLHCRKLSTILGKGESQVARRLTQLERAGILESEWVHRENNIKVYFLKTDCISLQITTDGIAVEYTPARKEKFFALESIFQVDIPTLGEFIDRENQLTLMDTSPFIVLTGIAGIGKTSLASFYANTLRNKKMKKVFWHTFSELDSVFFVTKKIAVFLSKYGYSQLLDYLKADGSDMRVVEALLKECMDNSDFSFFFDDYHFVTDEYMDTLFNQLKTLSGGKICVISRYKPSFVSAFDNILEVRLEEMGTEAVQQLLKSKGMRLEEDTLRKVTEKVGGHPLALELLCQASVESDPEMIMEEIPSSEIGIFLWDEIYSRLEPEEQQLLVTLSVFRNPVDIEAVTQMYSLPYARTVVKQLIRKNLLKKVNGGYIHHDVTRVFCLRLVQNVEELHREAAEYYLHEETSHTIIEAVYHLVEAQSYEEAARVILQYYEMLINEGYASMLFSFCQKVDFLPLYRHQILEVEGEIHLLQGEYNEAVTCFTVPLEDSPGPVRASLYRKLGEVYERMREYQTAEKLFLEGLDAEGDDTEQGSILIRLASVYTECGLSEKALSCCERALALFSESEYRKGIAQVYSMMGGIYRFSNTEKALELLSSSLEISEKIGDVLEAASTLATIGNVLYERGRTDEAVKYYEKSLHISEETGNIIGIARCCNNIGVKYALEWKWPHAMEYYKKTLSICERVGDKKGISLSYSNLGRAYSRFGLWEKALEYFFASLDLAEQLSDKREISFLYCNIGDTSLDMGNFAKALTWLEKSLAIREEIGYTLGCALCYSSIGMVYNELGEHGRALQCLEKSREIHEREKGTWMVSTVNVIAAQVYVDRGDFERALDLVADAATVMEEVGDREWLVRAYQVLAEAYQGLENFAEALNCAVTCLEHACEINSSVYEGKARRILGTVLCEMGEYERAEEELRLSMRLLKEYIYELAKTHVQFALLCSKKGQRKKGEVLLERALTVFEDLNSEHNVRCCKQYLLMNRVNGEVIL